MDNKNNIIHVDIDVKYLRTNWKLFNLILWWSNTANILFDITWQLHMTHLHDTLHYVVKSFHTPILFCSIVIWCDHPRFDPVTQASPFQSYPDHQSSHGHSVDILAFQWDCWHQLKQQVSYFDTLSVSCSSLKEWQDEVRGAFPVILPFGLLFNNIQQYPLIKWLLTVTKKSELYIF